MIEIDQSSLSGVVREYEQLRLYDMSPQDVVFEERVKLNCFYCKHYGLSWKCPPRTPQVDYQKLVREYEHGVFARLELPFTQDDLADVRVRSTNELHRALLKLERYLWDHNRPLALSFIGGSCKLCKNGCGKDRCNHPYEARMSMEAAGINVVKSLEKYGITVAFPPKNTLVRVGMLLW